ncbi:gliding motility-associated C-terminal domain-containing protein [Hymenobacter sp. 15J16-1T3B]|uniref:T9SS type B sorting domain-containing protein n=1 Tax=Hymenobacter sp. 15J16-1T3B TaxID=2886941 RepID=UPI001D11BCB1|nr:gliding motility-associated C-terminal domain-containing protein [Hymenobacter sp. 15J16-1T3B]MCC3157042.1 gliding motility-associated C-terminal domain-containing protein [Hymenobacter sp. 15J16-1T3B]
MRLHGYFIHVLSVLALCLGLLRPAAATHIVGGELDLQYQSGSAYRLTLTLYFDAINGSTGAIDADATAGIFEKGSNRRIQDVTLSAAGNSYVPYTNPVCAIGSLSTRKLLYSTLLTLPATVYDNPNGYYVTVERCCRNGVINNIVAPGDAGQAYYLEFPAVVQGGQAFRNSTPRIFPPLSDYACLGELFYFNFGGQDADGDSLAYDMVTPLNGHANVITSRPAQASPAPYTEVSWQPGLSRTNQMPGAPTLSIDARTGRLTVRPTRLGLFVFGVRCSEYRRGVKIGETRRDFQLLVIACQANQTPQLVVAAPGNGAGTYQPGRDTLRLLPGPNRCLRLRFTDPDPTSQLQVELRAVNFAQALVPPATLTQGTVRGPGMPDTLTSTVCFPDCFNSHGRVYLLDVIVADNGCSLPRRDTVRVAFTAQGPPNQPPTVALVSPPTQFPIVARVGDLVEVDVEGVDLDRDDVSLELNGRGFTPASVGAQFSVVSAVPGRTVARLRWRVDCRAVARGLHEFEVVASASPCQDRQTSPVAVVPIRVQYANAAPVLTSTLPAAPTGPDSVLVIRRRLGDTFTATFTGRDADLDGLTLAAAPAGFELGAVGMSFSSSGGPGTATGNFRWTPGCEAAQREPLEVSFSLVDNTCQPLPQHLRVRFEVERPGTPEFLPANIITPNNDTRNDYFALPTLPPDFCEQRFASIIIFSRWGNKVYESPDRNFRWDGRGVAEGVYYYQVEYTDGRRFKGTVTVMP